MLSKFQIQRCVHKQELMLRAVEQRSDFVVKGYARRIDQLAKRAYTQHAKVSVPAADQNKFTDRIVDLMLLGFVQRYAFEKESLPITRRNTRRKRRSITLAFQDDVATLAQELELDLGNVRANFTPFAKKRVKGAFTSLEDRINTILADVTSKQLPTRQGIREFNRQLSKAGIAVRKPAVVETLVRTHAQCAMGAAQYQLDLDDPEDLIWGYTYSTVGDDRVRDEHWEMEGFTAPKNDRIWNDWWPPNGWNCRCQLVSIIGSGTKTRRRINAAPDEGWDFHPGKLLVQGDEHIAA
jgi:SPP1 gp7 family putative phage head morphogenesis protein